jgi:hypothetical protein
MRKHGLLLALMLAAACYAPLDAHAATCSNASLKGPFSISITGPTSGPNQSSAAGQLTADGVGGLTGVMTLSANGQVSRNLAITGTYSVLAGCTGTATLNYTGGGSFSFDIFINANGFMGVEND